MSTSVDRVAGPERCDGCGAVVSGARTYRDDGEVIATLGTGCQLLLGLRGDDPSDIEQYRYVGGGE